MGNGSARPSIKGAAFSGLVQTVLDAVGSGSIARELLAERLGPDELGRIEGPIQVSQWYDIRLHDQLLEVLRDARGPRYIDEFGAANAKRLMDTGLYQQLDYLGRRGTDGAPDPRSRFLAFGADLRLIVTLSSAILNFSRWEVKPDPEFEDRYSVEISEAGDYSDLHIRVLQAFMNELSSRNFPGPFWSVERPRRDLVRFRMNHSLS